MPLPERERPAFFYWEGKAFCQTYLAIFEILLIFQKLSPENRPGGGSKGRARQIADGRGLGNQTDGGAKQRAVGNAPAHIIR